MGDGNVRQIQYNMVYYEYECYVRFIVDSEIGCNMVEVNTSPTATCFLLFSTPQHLHLFIITANFKLVFILLIFLSGNLLCSKKSIIGFNSSFLCVFTTDMSTTVFIFLLLPFLSSIPIIQIQKRPEIKKNHTHGALNWGRSGNGSVNQLD